MTLDPDLISFRRLTEDDFPLMHRWLNTEHVARWYRVRGVPNPALDWVTDRYLPRIRGDDPTRAFVIMLGPRPIGYIQGYLIADDPAYSAHVQVGEGAAGVDMFIGETDVVHKGLGSHIVRRFLADIVFQETGALFCIIGPEPENAAAIRAYVKGGFRYVKTVRIPDGDAEYEFLMRLGRDEVIDN
ncbi:MAG TPA: GNAT family N-acetyltransferase [Dehalococcoidia bacterium]|nr:GNAT family N-acetyltransferase [Dehalococcoidia bacterium]